MIIAKSREGGDSYPSFSAIQLLNLHIFCRTTPENLESQANHGHVMAVLQMIGKYKGIRVGMENPHVLLFEPQKQRCVCGWWWAMRVATSGRKGVGGEPLILKCRLCRHSPRFWRIHLDDSWYGCSSCRRRIGSDKLDGRKHVIFHQIMTWIDS